MCSSDLGASVEYSVSGSPFTARVQPGQCLGVYENLSGTTFSTDLNIGSDYVDKVVCLQPQVDASLDSDSTVTYTGYANWQNGSPFFGNLCFAPDGTPTPVGALGVLGLSGLLSVAFAAAVFAKRRSSATASSA